MPSPREHRPGPTAASRLADALRGEVLRGVLAPGQPLREEDLATATGHSRHTVRTALARLVAERLAVAAPYRGVRVTSFDDADVVALQQLRGALEAEAVRLLREQHGPAWPAALRTALREPVAAMAAADPGDWPAVAAAHAAIHRGLVTAAGSPRITEAYDHLDGEMLLLLVHVRPATSLPGLVAEHREYLDLVASEGPAAVRRHLDHATRLILEARA